MADRQGRRPADAKATGMTLLPIHNIAGLTAIIAGYVAVFSLKGMKLHRKSGIVFVYAMVVLSLTGTVIAAMRNQPASVIGGGLAFYLVITSLLTVRPRDQGFHWVDAGATVIGIAVGTFSIKLGVDAVNSPTGAVHGVPAGMIFLFATVAMVGALGDA